MRGLSRLAATIVTIAVISVSGASVPEGESETGDGWLGSPVIENTGTAVQVSGNQTADGESVEGQSRASDGGGGDSGGGGESIIYNPGCPVDSDVGPVCGLDVLAEHDDPAVPGIPDVTLADIATFAPARPSITNEPAGLGVVGMPTNFVAAASTQSLAGRLFDAWDVVVTFVPVGYRFNYGDGTSVTASSGGESWSALGQAEFTPTDTSHAYTARGTYTAAATVLYAATVDFGAGVTRSVDGYVEATTGGYGIRIVEVRTALVDKTCIENPAGPGC